MEEHATAPDNDHRLETQERHEYRLLETDQTQREAVHSRRQEHRLVRKAQRKAISLMDQKREPRLLILTTPWKKMRRSILRSAKPGDKKR